MNCPNCGFSISNHAPDCQWWFDGIKWHPPYCDENGNVAFELAEELINGEI